MTGPLTGARIVELAGIGPGPFAAMMLSDMGAEVLRVDRAESVRDGDAPPLWDVNARGRRSVGVDLKHPAGRDAVLRLVEQADALIDPFRPGVTERLGIGPRRVSGARTETRLRTHDGVGPGRAVPRTRPGATSTTSPCPGRCR